MCHAVSPAGPGLAAAHLPTVLSALGCQVGPDILTHACMTPPRQCLCPHASAAAHSFWLAAFACGLSPGSSAPVATDMRTRRPLKRTWLMSTCTTSGYSAATTQGRQPAAGRQLTSQEQGKACLMSMTWEPNTSGSASGRCTLGLRRMALAGCCSSSVGQWAVKRACCVMMHHTKAST